MNYESLTTAELIEECTNKEKPEAWKEFVRRFQPLIAGVVVRTAQRYGQVSVSVADDLVQETYLKLCTAEWKPLREVQRQGGNIYGFMKAVARTVALDYFKAQYAEKRGAGVRSQTDCDVALRTATQTGSVDDQILVREIDKLAVQIAETARDRKIFLLYYKHGLTAKAIAAISEINLSQKGVESCLLRLTRQLQRQLNGTSVKPSG